MFKIYLCNVNSIGTRCGYGEGRTREEAIANALEIARRTDPEAYFDGREVCYWAGVRL